MRSTIGVTAALVSFAAILAASTSGCGGSVSSTNSAASCGTVAPCGGSVLGTWTIAASCESISEFTFGQPCPAGTIDLSQLTVSGSLVFRPDMTFTTSSSISGTRRFSVPLDCVAPIGSCDQLVSLVVPAPPDATVTCTTTGTTCDCSQVYNGPMLASGSGTYVTAGNVLTSTASATDTTGTSENSYCVQGGMLHLLGVDSTTGDVLNDTVATK